MVFGITNLFVLINREVYGLSEKVGREIDREKHTQTERHRERDITIKIKQY